MKLKLRDLAGLSPAFIFQDNTFTNSLRVCADSICQNLGDTNVSNITGINSVYEIAGDKLNVDPFSLAVNNIWFIGGFAFLFCAVFFVYLAFLRGKK